MTVLDELLAEWRLEPDGAQRSGHTAIVLPVLTDEGRPAALKVGTRHPETEHEHLALQHWHGDGAVLLLRADPRRMAMLLERLSTNDLTALWDIEACEIVAGFYRRLHIPGAATADAAVVVRRGARRATGPSYLGTHRCRGGWSIRRSLSAEPSPRTPPPTGG